MRWSWNHATDEVWRQLDPELWEITHNPWVVLQTVSRDQIERVLADPVFRKNVDDLLRTTRHGCACGPRPSGLHGASDTALRRRCDPTERRTNPLAAMIRSTQEKTISSAS